MAARGLPKRACRGVRCPAITAASDGFCDSCRSRSARVADERRGTAAERGYDRTWQKFREAYIAEHPLCMDCLDRGIIEPTTDVHHIRKLRDGGERLDAANCRALCHRCHAIRTARGE